MPLYLGGFSVGAVIATILTLEQSDDIAGLFLISPACHSQLNSLLGWSWIYAWFKPWMFGGLIYEDNPIKYNSIPINSGTQYYRTTQYLKITGIINA
jgi:alpha-beta hydrolase superfamily lysophospholipase